MIESAQPGPAGCLMVGGPQIGQAAWMGATEAQVDQGDSRLRAIKICHGPTFCAAVIARWTAGYAGNLHIEGPTHSGLWSGHADDR